MGKQRKIGLICVILLLVFLILLVGVLTIMYKMKLNNCVNNPQIYCPDLVCSDGSTPFENMVWYTRS